MNKLHESLKAGTSDLHRSIDRHALFRDLLAPSSNQSEVRVGLLFWSGFHNSVAIGKNVFGVPALQPYMDTQDLRWALGRDMQRFKVKNTLTHFRWPIIESLEELIGFLYVREGSQQGAVIIDKILRNPARPLIIELEFLSGYESLASERWQQFLTILASLDTRVNIDKAVAAAQNWFCAIIDFANMLYASEIKVLEPNS